MTDKSFVKIVTKTSYYLILGGLLVVFCFNYWQAAYQSQKNHEKRLDRAVRIMSKSLEVPIWSMDNSTITLIGEAFMGNVDVAQLTISSTDLDQPLYHRTDPDKTNVLYAERKIIFNDIHIGSVKIGISGESDKGSLKSLIIQSLILFTSLALLLILAIRHLLHKHLGAPLLNFGDWTDRVANGEYGEEPPQVILEEFKTLAQKFVNMAEKVKSREQELLGNERKFRGLFENSEVSIWNEDLTDVVNALTELRENGVSDLRTYLNDHPQKIKDLAAMIQVIEVNDATLKLFCAKDQQDIIKNFENIFTTDSIQVIKEELCAIWDKQTFFRSEVTYIDLKGGEIDAIISFHIPEALDGYQSIPINIIDISDLKRAEEELLKYRDQLQQLVDSQTEQLKEAHFQLIQKEKLTTLGKLTATVSHELRNPLGTVRNAVYSLNDELGQGLPEHLGRLLSLAERNIVRCVDIIEDLLDYTRVKKMVFSETNLSEWIRTLTDEYELPKSQKLDLELATGPPVLIDRERLRHVLLNLLANASDALLEEQSDGNLIKIISQFFDDEFVICVQDDGIGMSEETLSKVFEPLYSTKDFGIGLGMVITKNIVERHHGTIDITSSIGEGTSVKLRLPVCPAE